MNSVYYYWRTKATFWYLTLALIGGNNSVTELGHLVHYTASFQILYMSSTSIVLKRMFSECPITINLYFPAHQYNLIILNKWTDHIFFRDKMLPTCHHSCGPEDSDFLAQWRDTQILQFLCWSTVTGKAPRGREVHSRYPAHSSKYLQSIVYSIMENAQHNEENIRVMLHVREPF